ncbi:hypothetical protein J2I47_21500 [Fibrella sp. HMF5335]|uniref:Uncharacterized protein n=1 Tax=Fibrella rubiginis TaxID=2817060 RepID=A0A939K7Y5_9BACT|nr:hypothetical protein [Fibrella rubiginis]MBO0939145.1 hypothetical protein [Fibrella rubiginis]
MIASSFPYAPVALSRVLPPLPGWLADEASLADEAVLFGLSEARPEERVAQIRLAFAERTVWLEKQIEQAQEQVGDLNLAIETAHAQLHERRSGPQPPRAERLFSVAGQRFLLWLVVSLLISAGAFWSVDTLFPATSVGLLMGALLGMAGVGVALIRYRFDQKARLEQQRADRLHHDEQTTKARAEVADLQLAKQQVISSLYQAEAHRDAQYAHRDRLIRLFESEFDLARSLRYSLKPDDAPYV